MSPTAQLTCLYAGEWVDVSPPPDLLLSLCRGLERRDKDDISRMLPITQSPSGLQTQCFHPVHLTGSFLKWSKAADALVRVRGLYSISGHFYNPILFDTVHLSGSNYKRVKNMMTPAVHFVDITYMLRGKNTDLSVRHKLNKTVHIWNKKAEETQGIESVIIHISLKRSNGLINRVRAKKTNVFRAGLSDIAKNNNSMTFDI